MARGIFGGVSGSGARRRELSLNALLVAWLLVLPFSHVTGLRNTCAVLAIALALGTYGLGGLRELPAGKLLVAYALWGLLSFFWSADRVATLSKIQSDLILPLFGYAAGYLHARSAKKPFAWTVALLIALILLALLSAVVWIKILPLDGLIPEELISGVKRPMPIWYPGVGDASMFAILCIGPLLLWCGTGPRITAYLRGFVVAASLGIVVAVSGNRNAFTIAPLAVGLFLSVCLIGSIFGTTSLAGEPRVSVARTSRPLTILAIACLALLLAGIALETASRVNLERSGRPVPHWGQAAIELIHSDARPTFWRQYEHLGLQNRWVGVGFGRTVPAVAYDVRHDTTFSLIDPAGRTHAHNIFIDTWLQTGFIGLSLFVAVLVNIIYSADRYVTSGRHVAMTAAAITTLAIMTVLHNLTDDFLVYGMADGFWLLLGLLFGDLVRHRSIGGPVMSVALEGPGQ